MISEVDDTVGGGFQGVKAACCGSWQPLRVSRHTANRPDMRAIGAMAAEHLLERGFPVIAFAALVGGSGHGTSQRCGRPRCAGGGKKFWGALESAIEDLQKFEWQEERGRIAAWLKDLPRPLGIVAGNDVRAYHVLDACRAAGPIVPEEVAVVGAENLATFCECARRRSRPWFPMRGGSGWRPRNCSISSWRARSPRRKSGLFHRRK